MDCASCGHSNLDDARFCERRGEPLAAFARSTGLARERRIGREFEPWAVAGLCEALLGAGERSRALQVARESVALVLRRGTKVFLPMAYLSPAEALLACEEKDRVAEAQQALDDATAVARRTGALAELPLIERGREKLTLGDEIHAPRA